MRPPIPPPYATRTDAKLHATALAAYGGSAETEKAVLAGLRWLVKAQNPDGTWGDGLMRPAMTGFSLLSLLGHGELPSSPEFGPPMQKALAWVLESGAKYEGKLCNQVDLGGCVVDGHAILTQTLAEFYAMTKDERVAPLLKQAAGYIVAGQNTGGWAYGYIKSEKYENTAVSGWQIQALDAVRATGLEVTGMPAAFARMADYLRRIQAKDGSFDGWLVPGGGYQSERYSYTAVGTVSSYLCNGRKDPLAKKGVSYLFAHTKQYQPFDKPEGSYPVRYQDDKADLYAWYFNSQAFFIAGDNAWTRWNRWATPDLLKIQSPDGSWPAHLGGADFFGDAYMGQHWALQKDLKVNGPIYRTNLCVLMLETYYRCAAVAPALRR